MPYSLYNISNNKKLTHPKVGLWFTNNLDEAKEMLKYFHEYLDSSTLSEMKKDICIINLETSDIIKL